MIDFELTEPQKDLREALRAFAKSVISPGAAERDENMSFPYDLIPKMAAMKLFGIAIPEKYGGAGLGTMEMAIVLEEIGQVDGAIALIVASHNSLCTMHLHRFGTEAQRERYVVPLAKGEKLGAWALTEAGSGSDAASLQTTAVLDRDEWVINGNKLFTTQGATAGIIVIMASTAPGKGASGISAFVVEKGTPGLSIGKPENKLGVRASDTASLHLENLRIPKENLVGLCNQGFQDVLQILDGGRIGIGAMAVGLARGALEASLLYAKEREQFGRPISDFQAIQGKLSDMSSEIEAARLLVYYAAFLKDHGEDFKLAASEAKLFASEAAMRACAQAIQIHGGTGYLKDAPVERYFRDAKICEIGEGTSEIQRRVIAKEVLQ
ncbi:MAG: acyl-CoA dehydrogenase family protein [Nitrospiria bacterium]